LLSDNGTDYLDCSCVASDAKMAFNRPCTTDCQNFYGFAVFMFVSIWYDDAGRSIQSS
jgi:hypothetical protein